LTYAEMNTAIDRVAHLLDGLGVQKGDRVLLCLENRHEYLLAWFALFRIGASTIHASYRSTTDELEYLIEHSGASLGVVSSQTREAAKSAATEDFIFVDVDADPDCIDFARWRGESDREFVSGKSDGAGENVVYTSGTTGNPKGATRDFASFGIVELSRLLKELPVQFGDRHLVVSPLYHSAAQAFTLIHTALGATVYLHSHFEPERVLETLQRHLIHSMFMVPTMIRRTLSLEAEVLEALNPPAFRMLISGAAPFPHDLREQAAAYFGEEAIFDFYGATELGWVTLISGPEMMLKPSSVGRPLDGQEIRIRADAADLPVGEVGKIYVKNAQTMGGYLHDQDATDRTRLGDWMTVDDLGWVDADGYLYLAGRDRDMIISGGVNIYPVEIEEVLARHEGVQDVAVIGLQHDEWGEELAAVIVSDADDDELENFARERLSGHKIPRRWFRVDALPRNPTGKVLKRELRARFNS